MIDEEARRTSTRAVMSPPRWDSRPEVGKAGAFVGFALVGPEIAGVSDRVPGSTLALWCQDGVAHFAHFCSVVSHLTDRRAALVDKRRVAGWISAANSLPTLRAGHLCPHERILTCRGPDCSDSSLCFSSSASRAAATWANARPARSRHRHRHRLRARTSPPAPRRARPVRPTRRHRSPARSSDKRKIADECEPPHRSPSRGGVPSIYEPGRRGLIRGTGSMGCR